MSAPAFLNNDDSPKEKGRLGKWQPKVWRPEYTRIVFMSASGLSNTDIAAQMGFSKEYISVILNLPEGKALAQQIHDKIKAKAEESIPDLLNYVAKKTALRLKTLLDDDEKYEKNPFAVIDRGMDVLKGLRHLTGGGNGAMPDAPIGGSTVNVGVVNINNGQKSEIMDGLDKLQQIKMIHGSKEIK